MADPLDVLIELRRRAPELGPPGEMLAAAIDAALAGDVEGLDEGLGLAGPGIERPATRWRRRRRDELIRSLAQLPADRQKARAVLDALRTYETTAWPRDRHHADMPASYLGTNRAALFQIFKLGTKVPASLGQIEAILGVGPHNQPPTVHCAPERSGLIDETRSAR